MKNKIKQKWKKVVLSDKRTINFFIFSHLNEIKTNEDSYRHPVWQSKIAARLDLDQITRFKATYALSSYGEMVDTIDSKSVA